MSGNNTIVGGGRVAKVVGDLLGLEDFLAPWPGALEKVTAAADLIRDAECMLALLKDAFVTCEVKAGADQPPVFAVTTADPRFDPTKPLTVGGFGYVPIADFDAMVQKVAEQAKEANCLRSDVAAAEKAFERVKRLSDVYMSQRNYHEQEATRLRARLAVLQECIEKARSALQAD